MIATDVAKLIAAADSKTSAGVLRGTRSDILLEVAGELDSIGRIAEIPLLSSESQALVRIGDIARVNRDWRTPPDNIALVDGNRSVLIALRMADDKRVDLWASEVNTVLDAFDATLSHNIVVDRIFEQERYTTHQLSELAVCRTLGRKTK